MKNCFVKKSTVTLNVKTPEQQDSKNKKMEENLKIELRFPPTNKKKNGNQNFLNKVMTSITEKQNGVPEIKINGSVYVFNSSRKFKFLIFFLLPSSLRTRHGFH